MLLLLLSPVNLLAQSDAKVVYNPSDKSLTFQKGGAVPEGATVYALNEGNNKPGWLVQNENITKVVFDSSFDAVRPTSCSSWFSGFVKMTELQGLEYLHTDAVENMNDMFSACIQLTSLDVSHFKTANVTDMSNMFSACIQLTSLDVSHFKTANVTDMSNMFSACIQLTSLDVSHFNTANVTDMSNMFSGCDNLSSLDLRNFDTSNVTNMSEMFKQSWWSTKLNSIDVSSFNTSNVTDMSNMFEGCASLTELNVSGFNTSKVTDMNYMFSECEKITSLDLRNFDTSQVTDMHFMFYDCFELTYLNVTSFNTSKVTDMSEMFESCEKLPSLDIRNFDTSNVKTMYKMFAYCYALPTIDVSHFNTSNVEDMGYLFYECSSLKDLDLTNFDTSKTHVTDEDPYYYGMESMFEYCKNLETIYVGDKFVITGEYSWMFDDCEKLFGAVGYDENKTGSDMANNQTGYLKKYNKYGEKNGEKVELYGYKAHYLRNHTYEWATMCLPFAFSTADNAAYRFYALKGVSADALSVTPLSGTIAAGTPVFVRGANTAGNKIEIVGVDDVLVETAQTQSGDGVEFTGTFGDVRGISDANYIIMQDKFWLAGDLRKDRPNSSVNVAALRAYLVPTTGGASRARVLNIYAEDGNITGIVSAETTGNDNTEIYDAQGRRLNRLQHGLNIVRTGGKTKKIIVK